MKFSVREKQNMTGWAFLTPAVILIFLMNFIPIIKAILMSFQTGKTGNMRFAGFINYARILEDSKCKDALMVTLEYVVVTVPLIIVLALILAVLLNDPKLKLKGIYRTCIFVPAAVSMVASAVIFRSLFATDGFVNSVLIQLGILETGYNFLGRPVSAKIILGGATALQRFFKITVPLLKPTLVFTLVMSVNAAIQVYDESVNLTNGGPGNATMPIAHYIYSLAFGGVPNFGYACALSVIVLIVVGSLTMIQMKAGDRRE